MKRKCPSTECHYKSEYSDTCYTCGFKSSEDLKTELANLRSEVEAIGNLYSQEKIENKQLKADNKILKKERDGFMYETTHLKHDKLFDDNVLLAKHSKELEAEIERLKAYYEKPCPECGGDGIKHGHNVPEHPITLSDTEALRKFLSCPMCSGSGTVPRVVLPDSIVQILLSGYLYFDTADFGNTFRIRVINDESTETRQEELKSLMEFTRISPDLWELTEARE